jgi:tyrosine-protein kinase
VTEPQDVGERLDLRQMMSIARRRWWLPVVCAFLVGGAAFVFSKSQQPQYTATASLLLRDTGLDQALLATALSPPLVDPNREANTNIEVVSSPAVAARTARALGIPLSVVAGEVTAAAEGITNVVAVNATDPSPQRAARLANTYARQAVKFSRDTDRSQVLEAQAAIGGQLNAMTDAQRRTPYAQLLLTRSQELRTLALADTGGAQVIAAATPPASPSTPRTKRTVVLGLLLGLVMGVGAAAFTERWSRRIRSSDELGDLHGLPVLSEVPRSPAMAEHRNGHVLGEYEREAFRVILAKLQYANAGPQIRSVLVTSAAAKEGKSTVAWHLAETIALRGRDRVILVETDLRNPVLAARHHLDATPGLADVLGHGTPLSEAIQSVTPRAAASHGEPGHDSGGLDTTRLPHELEPSAAAVRIFELGAVRSAGAGSAIVKLPSTGTMDVIVAGSRAIDPIRLLESARMGELLRILGETYDLVVLDTAPALVTADVMPLVEKVEGVLLVGRLGVTTRDQAELVKNELSALRAPMLGVVANDVKHGQGRYSYYPRQGRDGVNGHTGKLRRPHA